jgi:hypothetical protein
LGDVAKSAFIYYVRMVFLESTMRSLRFLILLFVAAGYSSASQALTVSPDVCTSNPTHCDTSLNQGGSDVSQFPVLAGLDLLYKFETDTNDEDGSATLAGSYSSTVTTEGTGDYVSAVISYGSGDIVDCSSPCYLTVKGGKDNPARYLFDLALSGPIGWDGVENLILSDFWASPDQGSISNFAIYGTAVSPIPVPAAVWLFGTALIGFVGMSRRREVA